jgi:hypothetical protein
VTGVCQEALSQQQSSYTRRLEYSAILLSDPQIFYNCKLLRIRGGTGFSFVKQVLLRSMAELLIVIFV